MLLLAWIHVLLIRLTMFVGCMHWIHSWIDGSASAGALSFLFIIEHGESTYITSKTVL